MMTRIFRAFGWMILPGCLAATPDVQGQSVPGTARPRADYLKAALLKEGDVARGARLFLDEARLGCTRCHSYDGKGGKAAPDLFAIGDKFGRREIIESILTPSATIAVGYNTTTISTKSGAEYSGVVKDATAEYVELIGADAHRDRIAVADIEERHTSDISLMPEDLQAGLSLTEFTDLVEYLVSRKVPASTDLVEHGMPATIPPLKQPIGLRPLLAESNRFNHPVWFGRVPGTPRSYLVAEHETGRIWWLEKRADGETKTVFAELGPLGKGTHGFIGMVLHPQFAENHKYYTAQHEVEKGRFATVIREREATADNFRDSGKPPRQILKVDGLSNGDHGGEMVFGPDGYMYVGMGDSGPGEDPQGNGQNLGRLLGKILRLDVDHPDTDRPYGIPANNPFVGKAGAQPEIWAYGLRVPWRLSFDPVTQELWTGDVGQDRYEEVDIVRPGENYGWNVYEGFERFSNRYHQEGATYVPPVFAYNRRYGICVTGGFVYRADPQSPFYGVYVFGDYQSKHIFGLTQENRKLKTVRELAIAPEAFAAFATDEAGALYLVGYEGMIYQLDFSGTRFE